MGWPSPQLGGANCECNGRVWRMDVGMSSGVLNAIPQVCRGIAPPHSSFLRQVRVQLEKRLESHGSPRARVHANAKLAYPSTRPDRRAHARKQVLEIDKDASGEVCVRLLTPAAPAGAVSAWAPDSEQLRPCCLV